MRTIFGVVVCLAVTTCCVSKTEAGTLPSYLNDLLSDVLGDEHFDKIHDLVNLNVHDYANNVRERYAIPHHDLPQIDLPIHEIPTFDDSHINDVLAHVQAARENAQARIAEIVETHDPGSHIPQHPISYGPPHAAVQKVLDRIEALALANGIPLFDPFAGTHLILGEGPTDNGSLLVGFDPIIGGGKLEVITGGFGSGSGSTIRVTDGSLLATTTLGDATIHAGSTLVDNQSVVEVDLSAGENMTFTNDLIFEGGIATWHASVTAYADLDFVDPNASYFGTQDFNGTIYEDIFNGGGSNLWMFGDSANFVDDMSGMVGSGLLDRPISFDDFTNHNGAPEDNTSALWLGTLNVVEDSDLFPSDITESVSEDDGGAWFFDTHQGGMDFGDLVLDDSTWIDGTESTESIMLAKAQYPFAIGFYEGHEGQFVRANEPITVGAGTIWLDAPSPSKGGATAVPEPSAWALLLAAGLGLSIVRAFRRRR